MCPVAKFRLILTASLREALKYSGFRPTAALEATVSVGAAKHDANKSALPKIAFLFTET